MSCLVRSPNVVDYRFPSKCVTCQILAMAVDIAPPSMNASKNGVDGDLAANGHVKVLPPSGINVLVVGGGIGGLTAALELHRKGHSVRLLERSKVASGGGKF
jgi:NADPH-dependent 2,4-dienoyl-CoA reductase/sulfur reductase-like enzyme